MLYCKNYFRIVLILAILWYIADGATTPSNARCKPKRYTHKAVQTDFNGLRCWDDVKILSCWGFCMTYEVLSRTGSFHTRNPTIRFVSMGIGNMLLLNFVTAILVWKLALKYTIMLKLLTANARFALRRTPAASGFHRIPLLPI